MKDVVFYVFFFALYAILALHFIVRGESESVQSLSWRTLGEVTALFFCAGALARWSVMALKKPADRLLKGQKIVGIEEGEEQRTIDVLKPAVLRRERKKPRLKRL